MTQSDGIMRKDFREAHLHNARLKAVEWAELAEEQATQHLETQLEIYDMPNQYEEMAIHVDMANMWANVANALKGPETYDPR